MRGWITLLLSIALGFLLMAPLAMLFNAMNWPMFHGWALAHGTFVIAWPALTLVAYGLVLLTRQLAREYRRREASRSNSRRL